MHIRRAAAKDLCAVADLYDTGRQTMYQQNNTFQWNENYPLLEDAVADYERCGLFVVTEDETSEEIIGCFSLLPGPDEAYVNIAEGAWINSLDYVVIHRVAVKYTGHGCTDPQKLDQNLTIRRSVFLWQNIVSNSRRKSF